MELYGRVAQLGEHLLCKHAVISPKSLNRRLLTVQTPLQIGLLIGLRKIKYFVEVWTNTPKNGLDSSERAPPETTTLACFLGSAQEFVETRILGGFLKNDEFGLGDRHALGLEQ